MDGIVGFFTSLPSQDTKKDDDFVDRLSSKYSVVILVVFSLVIGMNQYVGTPINCWMPQHFTGSHSAYTNAYCWVRNTYYLPYEEHIPKRHEDHRRQMVTYYQWMPFILLGQALLFYFPSAVWHSLNARAGVDADNILASAQTFSQTEQVEKRDSTLVVIRNQIHRFLHSRQDTGKGGLKSMRLAKKGYMGRRFGTYLIILYIFTKLLYLVNVVAQLFILNSVLSIEFGLYGYEVLKWMMHDYDWTTSPQVAFPRVTMCDFTVRRLGNLHPYTVQCTLPINLYNEKIYMFLWFWMVFVAVCTAFSLITWFVRAVAVRDRIIYIKNHLKMMERLESPSDEKKAEEFTKEYLRPDGIFLLRLIGHNTNTLTVTEIICSLWENWNPKEPRNGIESPPMRPTTDKAGLLE